MTILFGHPTGNPNSHHAALAHFEASRLEAFCVPWFPSRFALGAVARTPGLTSMGARLARRRFEPLAAAPMIQGRVSEWRRLILRAMGRGDEGLSYEANDWLMRTMRRASRRAAVTAVHSYEDCALWQFEEAKRLGKACIYDMPIAYYPAWDATEKHLLRTYAEWLPEGGLPATPHVRPAQKKREMELADLVLAPGTFVERTIREHHPNKQVALAAYGVDLEFWHPREQRIRDRPLRFLYAGQLALRKGTPLLLEAWEAANLRDAELALVGAWKLSERKRANLPRGVAVHGPCSPEELRERYLEADLFLFPSFFEGFGLVLLEAMACGLPAIASQSTAGPDVLTPACGEIVPTGELEPLVESLRRCVARREELPAMRRAARQRAEACTWEGYRSAVSIAVGQFT